MSPLRSNRHLGSDAAVRVVETPEASGKKRVRGIDECRTGVGSRLGQEGVLVVRPSPCQRRDSEPLTAFPGLPVSFELGVHRLYRKPTIPINGGPFNGMKVIKFGGSRIVL